MCVAGLLGRAPEDVDRSAGERHEAEDRLHERGLAGAVGAQHGDELPVADRERDVGEDRAAADADRGVLQRDGGRGGLRDGGLGHRPVAWCSAAAKRVS